MFDEPSIPASADVRGNVRPARENRTLLLVEDDTVLRGGLTELFAREGYNVVAASCAGDARAKLGEYIDLIVLDVMLPDGDGVALP